MLHNPYIFSLETFFRRKEIKINFKIILRKLVSLIYLTSIKHLFLNSRLIMKPKVCCDYFHHRIPTPLLRLSRPLTKTHTGTPLNRIATQCHHYVHKQLSTNNSPQLVCFTSLFMILQVESPRYTAGQSVLIPVSIINTGIRTYHTY